MTPKKKDHEISFSSNVSKSQKKEKKQKNGKNVMEIPSSSSNEIISPKTVLPNWKQSKQDTKTHQQQNNSKTERTPQVPSKQVPSKQVPTKQVPGKQVHAKPPLITILPEKTVQKGFKVELEDNTVKKVISKDQKVVKEPFRFQGGTTRRVTSPQPSSPISSNEKGKKEIISNNINEINSTSSYKIKSDFRETRGERKERERGIRDDETKEKIRKTTKATKQQEQQQQHSQSSSKANQGSSEKGGSSNKSQKDGTSQKGRGGSDTKTKLVWGTLHEEGDRRGETKTEIDGEAERSRSFVRGKTKKDPRKEEEGRGKAQKETRERQTETRKTSRSIKKEKEFEGCNKSNTSFINTEFVEFANRERQRKDKERRSSFSQEKEKELDHLNKSDSSSEEESSDNEDEFDFGSALDNPPLIIKKQPATNTIVHPKPKKQHSKKSSKSKKGGKNKKGNKSKQKKKMKKDQVVDENQDEVTTEPENVLDISHFVKQRADSNRLIFSFKKKKNGPKFVDAAYAPTEFSFDSSVCFTQAELCMNAKIILDTNRMKTAYTNGLKSEWPNFAIDKLKMPIIVASQRTVAQLESNIANFLKFCGQNRIGSKRFIPQESIEFEGDRNEVRYPYNNDATSMAKVMRNLTLNKELERTKIGEKLCLPVENNEVTIHLSINHSKETDWTKNFWLFGRMSFSELRRALVEKGIPEDQLSKFNFDDLKMISKALFPDLKRQEYIYFGITNVFRNEPQTGSGFGLDHVLLKNSTMVFKAIGYLSLTMFGYYDNCIDVLSIAVDYLPLKPSEYNTLLEFFSVLKNMSVEVVALNIESLWVAWFCDDFASNEDFCKIVMKGFLGGGNDDMLTKVLCAMYSSKPVNDVVPPIENLDLQLDNQLSGDDETVKLWDDETEIKDKKDSDAALSKITKVDVLQKKEQSPIIDDGDDDDDIVEELMNMQIDNEKKSDIVKNANKLDNNTNHDDNHNDDGNKLTDKQIGIKKIDGDNVDSVEKPSNTIDNRREISKQKTKTTTTTATRKKKKKKKRNPFKNAFKPSPQATMKEEKTPENVDYIHLHNQLKKEAEDLVIEMQKNTTKGSGIKKLQGIAEKMKMGINRSSGKLGTNVRRMTDDLESINTDINMLQRMYLITRQHDQTYSTDRSKMNEFIRSFNERKGGYLDIIYFKDPVSEKDELLVSGYNDFCNNNLRKYLCSIPFDVKTEVERAIEENKWFLGSKEGREIVLQLPKKLLEMKHLFNRYNEDCRKYDMILDKVDELIFRVRKDIDDFSNIWPPSVSLFILEIAGELESMREKLEEKHFSNFNSNFNSNEVSTPFEHKWYENIFKRSNNPPISHSLSSNDSTVAETSFANGFFGVPESSPPDKFLDAFGADLDENDSLAGGDLEEDVNPVIPNADPYRYNPMKQEEERSLQGIPDDSPDSRRPLDDDNLDAVLKRLAKMQSIMRPPPGKLSTHGRKELEEKKKKIGEMMMSHII
eukprot:TRINITY_DN41_c2_g4_i1.p1 TRINITY_DN41_c2_g4~~TRINITY_DN41_c2_g4_i1.p1  ORF type:complete len:1525 (+),score=488.44 TRINITY_DN41_c2_g4_i1:155-4576(+)